jgi:predicted DNA-binding transcriptional regulator YafY
MLLRVAAKRQSASLVARRARGITRAVRFARRMRILAAVIREPGLKPAELANRARVSESTLFRDLQVLRRQGYPVTFRDGYQLQEPLGLDGPSPATSLGAVYERQLELLRAQLPAALADQVQQELEAEAPAALAAIVAAVIERQVQLRRLRRDRPTG